MSELRFATELSTGPDFHFVPEQDQDKLVPPGLATNGRFRFLNVTSPQPDSSSFILGGAFEGQTVLFETQPISSERTGFGLAATVGSSYHRFQMLFDMGSKFDWFDVLSTKNSDNQIPSPHKNAVSGFLRPQASLQIGAMQLHTGVEASMGLTNQTQNNALVGANITPYLGLTFLRAIKKTPKQGGQTAQLQLIKIEPVELPDFTQEDEPAFELQSRQTYVRWGQQSVNIPITGKPKTLQIYDRSGLGESLDYTVEQDQLVVTLNKPIKKPGRYKLLLRTSENGYYFTMILREPPKSESNPIDLSERE